MDDNSGSPSRAWTPKGVVAVVGLMPGNILSGMLVQRLFWNTEASVQAVSLVRLAVMVQINAMLWSFLVYTFQVVQKARGVSNNSDKRTGKV